MLAMEIFEISRRFPVEEIGWLDFARVCKYISEEERKTLSTKNEEVGKLLNHMINNSEKY